MNNTLLHKTALLALTLLAGIAVSSAAVVKTVTVAPQQPDKVTAGQTATYTITATHTGLGSLDVYLTVSGLPAGVTANVDPVVPFLKTGTPSAKTALLSLAVDASVAPGIYNFLITARHGSSPNYIEVPATLVVGAAGRVIPNEPVITSVRRLPAGGLELIGSGTPGRSFRVLASETLTTPVWTDIGGTVANLEGILFFIDQDTANYSSRFYRLMAQ